MSWDRVIGQSRIKELLRRAVSSGQIAHAYLFDGPAGIGKEALALEFAKVLNCSRQQSDACDECASCKKMGSLQHPNVHCIVSLPSGKGEKTGDDPLKGLTDDQIQTLQSELAAKAADPYHQISIPKANFIKVNSIREIRRQASLTAQETGQKVFIIINADEMNVEASNSLLKTLEEPPKGTVLILITSRREQLLPTIISRCQVVRCEPLTAEEIARALQDRDGLSPEEANLAAKAANGSYGAARLLASEDMLKMQQDAVQYLRYALGQSRMSLLSHIEAVFGVGDREEVGQRLRVLQGWLHEAILLRSAARANGRSTVSEDLEKFVARFPHADLIRASEEVTRSIALLDKNVYLPLVLTTLAIDLHRCIGSPTP